MGLYWKDIEIIPGMMLAVDLLHNDIYNVDGRRAALWWKILSFGSRSADDAYLDFQTGKKFPVKKVVKSRRLQAKLDRGELLQLPAGIEYMVVQEFYDGEAACRRCYNLDMLQTVRSIKVIT